MGYMRSMNNVSEANEQHEVNNGEAEQLAHYHIGTLISAATPDGVKLG
jgi:hypothetical protein